MKKPLNLFLTVGAVAVLLVSTRKALASLPPPAAAGGSASTTAAGVDLVQWSTDIDTLARTLYGEARGEGWTGMQAVANVVMNRAAISEANGGAYWWGASVSDVCQKHSGSTFQFSCWSSADPNYMALVNATPDDGAFAQALQIATLALSGQLPDITRGSTNYYNPDAVAVTPAWARGQTPVAVIGQHQFFALV